jgi:hypothetical protein
VTTARPQQEFALQEYSSDGKRIQKAQSPAEARIMIEQDDGK